MLKARADRCAKPPPLPGAESAVDGVVEAPNQGSRMGLLAVPASPSAVRAELTLEGNIKSFEADGGAKLFEEEMGALVGARGRVEVIDVRAGSVIVTFQIHPPEKSTDGGEPVPSTALANLQKLLAAAPAKWAEDTQILSKTRPATLQVLEEPFTVASNGMRELELADASEDEVPVDRLAQRTPRAVPTQASSEYRAKQERTYEMLRFYTERAEPLLVQRYRSEELVLRRWFEEHPAGQSRAQQWGSSRPTTDAEWDVKIGEIIDGYLKKADGGQSARLSPVPSSEIRALFVELDRDGCGTLDAAGIAEVARRLGLELSGRRLQEAVEEMSQGGLVPWNPVEGEKGECQVEWEEFDCWFRLRQAIDGLPYPELMYATFVFEDGVDPRQVCRGHLPNIVSIPPECAYHVNLQASKHEKYDFPHRDQVYKDIPRTFSKHPQFATEDLFGSDEIYDETGRFRVNWRALPVDSRDVECGLAAPSLVQSLQNVLMAVVAHSPSGYTQGMNYVAATLLLHRSEEEAFDWLCRIVELYPGLYAGNLWGTRVETGAIDALLEQTPVGKHMANLNVSSQLFTTAWILPLFCSPVRRHGSAMQPTDSSLVQMQVLQHLIALEGRAQNTRLTRLSLSLFKMHEARLLATSDAVELMELVPKLPAAFGHTPQGICKRLVGMLALAQSDELVSDKRIVAERSQQRREVAVEARRRTFLRETLATCNMIEQDASRSFDVEELLACMRQHITITQRRAERKLKVRDTAQPQMGAVHIVVEEADASYTDSFRGDEILSTLCGDEHDSWEAQARSLFTNAAAYSKANDVCGMNGSTVTKFEFCALCEKIYMILEPVEPTADRCGGAALRPWLSAPPAAELRDMADMESWLTPMDSEPEAETGQVSSLRKREERTEPEPESETDSQLDRVGRNQRKKTGDAGRQYCEAVPPPPHRMVETGEGHPHDEASHGRVPASGSGWFARWRCCVSSSAATPSPAGAAGVTPAAAGGMVAMESDLETQMSEGQGVQHQGVDRPVIIPEGVPPS